MLILTLFKCSVFGAPLLETTIYRQMEELTRSVCVSCAAFCDCGMTYKPVCGVDDQTYGNACVAACFNQVIRHTGKCKKCPERFGGKQEFL